MKKKSSYDREGIDVSDTGRVVNRAIPDEERRRSAAAKKGSAKKRLKETKMEAEQRLVKKKKTGEKEGYKKRAEERDAETKPAKKKKKTAGDLLSRGKTKSVERKLDRFETKALAVMQSIQDSDGEFLPASNAPATVGSESEFFAEYGRIFGNLQSIIRRIEKNMLDEDRQVSSKDVYALCTMYSQMRETIADMRSIKDMNAQAEMFTREIISPLKRSSGEVIMAFYFKVSQIIRQHVSDPRALETMNEGVKLAAAEQGNKLESEFNSATAKIIDVLNGTK